MCCVVISRYFVTVSQREWVASIATMYVNAFKPTVVLVSDDNALQYFVVPFIEARMPGGSLYEAPNATNTSFVFSGINVNPEVVYQKVIPSNAAGNRSTPVCGTLERAPVVKMLKIMKQVKPTMKHVALLTDQGAWCLVFCQAPPLTLVVVCGNASRSNRLGIRVRLCRGSQRRLSRDWHFDTARGCSYARYPG